MAEPFWKHLVEELVDRGVSNNPYLDRLSDRLTSMQMRILDQGSIEQEIISEMAFSLCNAEDKINAALLRVSLLEESDDIESYNAAVDDAEHARWEFMVQREAIGFTDHQVLREIFPIPTKRRRSG